MRLERKKGFGEDSIRLCEGDFQFGFLHTKVPDN